MNLEKKVRFSDEPPSEYFYTLDVERETIWWQPNDFDDIKTAVKNVVREAKLNESSFVGVAGVYKFAEVAATNITDEEKLAKALEKVKVDPILVLWCTKASGRGLESTLRKFFTKKAKTNTRTSYMAYVVAWQDVVSDEDLAQKCMSLSRQDRILARMMGEADATAAIEAQTVGHLSLRKYKLQEPAKVLGAIQPVVTKRMWIPQSA